MSELNYEIKEYKEWLNKPNFIIDIDRSDFTLFQNKGLNLILYNTQITFVLQSESFKSLEDILSYKFVLTSKQVADLLGIESGTSTPISYIAKEMEKLSNLKCRNFKDGGYEIWNLLSKVKYDPLEMEIRYTITKDLFDFMYNKKGDFTRLDLREFRKYKLSKYGYALLEVLFRYSHFFKKGNYVEFTPLEFKKLVGASIDITNSYFKNKVLIKTLDELKEVVGITVDYSLDNSGKFNKIRTLRLHLNLNNPINKAFIYRQPIEIKKTTINIESKDENISRLINVMKNKNLSKNDFEILMAIDEYKVYVHYLDEILGIPCVSEDMFSKGYKIGKHRVNLSEEDQNMI